MAFNDLEQVKVKKSLQEFLFSALVYLQRYTMLLLMLNLKMLKWPVKVTQGDQWFVKWQITQLLLVACSKCAYILHHN